MRVRDEAIYKESLGGKEEKRCVRVPARTGGSVRIRGEGLHSLARLQTASHPTTTTWTKVLLHTVLTSPQPSASHCFLQATSPQASSVVTLPRDDTMVVRTLLVPATPSSATTGC